MLLWTDQMIILKLCQMVINNKTFLVRMKLFGAGYVFAPNDSCITKEMITSCIFQTLIRLVIYHPSFLHTDIFFIKVIETNM